MRTWATIVRTWEWQAGDWSIARRRVAADSLEFSYDLWHGPRPIGTYPTLEAAQQAAEEN